MSYIPHIKRHITDRKFLRSLGIAAVLFIVSLVLNYYASNYATKEASSPVTDIILSNTRVYDVDILFVFGTFALISLIALFGLQRFNRIPYLLEAIALFYAIRSVFLTLTHIAPFPMQVSFESDIFTRMNFGGDLFFSGHTGLPFLVALIFWKDRPLRYLFLGISVLLAVVVLLGHLHYTIDVASAYFITYSIYRLTEKLFAKDLRLFHDGLPNA